MNDLVLTLTDEAREYLDLLARDKGRIRIYKAVSKSLILMSRNLRHPSLSTHQMHTKRGPNNEKIFESYAQNRTPSAHRIFWYYGPGKNELTIVTITPHP